MVKNITIQFSIVFIMLSFLTVNGGERLFTLSNEARFNKPGEWEFEQWATWQTNKRERDQSFDRWDFRSELEYSLTEKFALAVYFDTRYEDTLADNSGEIDFHDVALEAVYTFTDAVQDPIGSAIYAEVKYGDEDEFLEVETKLLLTKQVGAWTFNYNFVFEHEWEEKGYEEESAKWKNIFGVSYEVNRNFRAGLELMHSNKVSGGLFDYEEGSDDHVVYLGPVVHFAFEEFWVTLSTNYQISETPGEAELLTRIIVGFSF